MKKFNIFIILIILASGIVFALKSTNSFDISIPEAYIDDFGIADVPESEDGGMDDEQIVLGDLREEDIPNQKPLSDPPSPIKAIYATSWTASSNSRMDDLIELINNTELNAIVIDIKDFSGKVLYDTDVAQVHEYGTEEVRIRYINSLIKKLHDNGIYVIARQTVFQDPALLMARPDLGVLDNRTGELWEDNKGLSWVDAGSREAWDYNIAIAKDATSRGFDEINFDYIRFPSDGKISAMEFRHFDASSTLKTGQIKKFFEYLDENTGDMVISADLFGLATVNYDGLGIGQQIEDAYKNFDYVAPMVYPSHYAKGFNGFSNPAEHPYEVVNFSMESANNRLNTLKNSTSTNPDSLAKLRPWLQDFDLGATYDIAKIQAQFKAVSDVDSNMGWMLWDPRNEYTRGALSN